MKTQKNLHQKLMRFVLSTAALFSTTVMPVVHGLIPAAQAATINAKRADSFVDSMCVNTHLRYLDTVYANYNGIKQKLLELGIRHIRDSSATNNDWIAKVKDLAAQGIKTTLIMDPNYISLAPNSSYWTSGSPTYIKDFVKKVGTNVIEGVEILNEIDLNYGNYYWRPGDTQKLNDNPNSSLYWGKYIRSATQDTWNILKSDPATAGVKVLGPSLARWYEYSSPNPVGDLSAYVDWGNFHPYPFGGNPTDGYFSYNTLKYYYLHGNFPSVNIDEYPHSLVVYSRPFGSKPMAATETGYFTGTDNKAISENVHAKYMPRLFLEYFRKGIVRTCSYEFVDQGKNLGWMEANFGLLRNDLSPKPAYTALKNMIGLLKDPGASFTPGSLNYTITVNPPAGYNRTQYVHSVLLQKQNGKFYLALWHEISNNDISTSPAREIAPPNMPTAIAFNSSISSAIVHSLENNGSMSSTPVTINNNTININVKDRVSIIEITAQSQPVTAQPQQVTAYQDRNFAGTSQSFSTGTYLAYRGQLNTVGNDQISSLRVPTAFKARVCEHEGGGLCRDYGPGEYSYVGDDLNDKISFINVQPQ